MESTQNLTFTGWIIFWSYLHWIIFWSYLHWIIFWSYLHWLNRLLLILPSLTRSSFDLTFTGWIVFFWSYFHWLDRLLLILPSLDRLLILPLLVGSSFELAFTWLHFFLILILLITIQVFWTGNLKWDMTFFHIH